MSPSPHLRRACGLALTVGLLTLGPPVAAAQTPDSPAARQDSPDTAPRSDRWEAIDVYSPSMQRNIPLEILRPADTGTPAPTLYLLNGAGGGEDGATWEAQTDVAEFFAGRHVNVVVPMEGAFSYYTDWRHPDPGLAKNSGNNGINMWTTFLTEELPPVIDERLDTTGANALAGLSMAGTSVLDLAIQAPDLYRAVASYSGCAMTSEAPGRQFVTMVVGAGTGDADNMWGPPGDPEWAEHDPYLNADKLPDIPIYVASGNGLPGAHDSLANPRLNGNPITLGSQLVVGGVIEAATNYCTYRLAERTRDLGRTNVQYDFRPNGTHSWGYWQDDLHRSWPMLADALGAPR
ncbi:alpha/beta hydrolase [Rhodococcus sp. NPDC058505]|uniref:alpha/beta hydrolase n=1 Tax=unclassified Rhodococcus (in: high G+C Gram-positive bacteria) TaxID=192944 RepID=UPI003665C166